MPEIQAEMHLSKQQVDNVWAYGFVTVDKLLRFPVQMRKYRDQNQEEKSFLSFPRRKTREGWEDVVHPDPELREAITIAVGEAIKEALTKDIVLPEVDSVEVTPLRQNDYTGTARICGLATVKIEGLTIKGITIKQTDERLFVNMHQYRTADGEYHDTVYGTTKSMQDKISEAVLGRYQEIMEMQAEKAMGQAQKRKTTEAKQEVGRKI